MTRSPTLCAEMSVIERIAFIFLTSDALGLSMAPPCCEHEWLAPVE